MSAGRSAHQDEKVVGEVAPGLKDEKVQEHGHDPMEGPDLEVVSNKLDCSQRVVENQKQMLATVQSLIELVRFRALSGFRAMRRFRDLLCSLIYCVEIQVSSPGGGMNGVSDLYKSSASSVVQYDDDDMDPISESLLSSGTRRQAMLTSDTLTGTSDSRGNKSSGDEISSQSNMLIKTRLMFSANDNDSTANGIEPRSIHAVPTPLKSRVAAQYSSDREAVGPILFPLPATQLRPMVRTQDSVEVEWMRCKMPETEATPLRGSVRFQYPIEEEGEEDGGAEIGAGDIEGRRSRLREVDATPLRSTIRFQYPIEEEGEEDGGAEIGAGDIEGRRSRLREVDATPLRSTIRFQYPIEEEGEEDGGAEIGAGDIEGRRSRLREVDATPLRSTIRFQYPIEEEGEEDGGAEIGAGDIEGRRSRLREVWFQYPEAGIDEAEQDVMGVEPDREALEISVKPMIEPRGYTPLSKVVSRRYPINSRVKREESTPIAMPVGGPSFHDLSSAEAERYLGVRLPLQHWAVGSQEMSPTPRCLSSSRGGEMVTLQSKQEREGKENWIHLAKPNSNGSRGQGPEQATREMPFSDLRPPTNDTPLKFYELSLPASRKVIPPKRLVR
jgi:hypothetical protein